MDRIYTKVGDEGLTVRGDGQRVPKCDARIEAGGAIDELNAHLGLCLCQAAADGAESVAGVLEGLQEELMAAGALLAGAPRADQQPRTLDESHVERLERQIDALWAKLPELHSFVLPRGGELACRLHVARTVCRRAERSLSAAARHGPLPPILPRYLNRLGDLLFVLCRQANQLAGTAEQRWTAPAAGEAP